MGCQTSKLDHQKEEMFPKLPPLLSRMLEETKRRRAGATLSKKQLLKDDFEDDCASGHRNGSKSSVSSAVLLDDLSLGSAKVAPEPTQPEEIFGDKDKEDEQMVVEAVTTTMEKLALEKQEDGQKVEEHGWFRSVEDSLICPRSPSFRLYLVDSLQDSENDHGKVGSLSDTDVDSTAETLESQASTEELASKIKKRGRLRMRSFRRVITKGKPVKNFLSVKSCYYLSCGDQEISRQSVAAKSATT